MPAVGPPPPGGDQNIGLATLMLQSVFITASTLVIALRLFVRIRILNSFGIDDYLILAALILGWVIWALVILMFQEGSGRHVYYLTEDQIRSWSKHISIVIILLQPQGGFSRLSFAFFLKRVAPATRFWQFGVWALISSISIAYFVFTIMGVTACTPISKLWDRVEPGGCLSISAQNRATGAAGLFSLVCDIALAVFPIGFLINLRMDWSKKITVIILMGLGVFAGIASLLRVLTVFTGKEVVNTDPTWNVTMETVWATVEEVFLLLGASIPAIQPLFKRAREPGHGYVPQSYGSSGDRQWSSAKRSLGPQFSRTHKSIDRENITRNESSIELRQSDGLRV